MAATRKAVESAYKKIKLDLRSEDLPFLDQQVRMLKHFAAERARPALDPKSKAYVSRLSAHLSSAAEMLSQLNDWGFAIKHFWPLAQCLMPGKPECLLWNSEDNPEVKDMASHCKQASNFFDTFPQQMNGRRIVNGALDRALWFAAGIKQRAGRPHFAEVAVLCNALCPGAKFTAVGLRNEAKRRNQCRSKNVARQLP